MPRISSVHILQFCVDKLIAVDSKNDVVVFSIENAEDWDEYICDSATVVRNLAMGYVLLDFSTVAPRFIPYTLSNSLRPPASLGFWT